MSLSIVTAVCGALDITEQWIKETLGSCTQPQELVMVVQAADHVERRKIEGWLIRLNEAGWEASASFHLNPLGSTKAFNIGIAAASGDVVAMLHNDLMIRQDGWDQDILGWFEAHPETGVVGFHGSRQLGHDLIYRSPYNFTQLGRGDNWSNLEDAESHGGRTDQPMEVVTVDGMALIARREYLVEWGGLEEAYVHHLYDHDLCLTSRQHGLRNYLLPVRARHISGQTANASKYNDHFRRLGSDEGIHRVAHELFYAKWRQSGLLPARI